MKLLVAGSRSIHDYNLVARAILESGFSADAIISGGAMGVDRLGELWARQNGVPVERHLADWARYGKSAGQIRNAEMATKADATVIIWDGKSPGTAGTLSFCNARGIPVHLVSATTPAIEAGSGQRTPPETT